MTKARFRDLSAEPPRKHVVERIVGDSDQNKNLVRWLAAENHPIFGAINAIDKVYLVYRLNEQEAEPCPALLT